MLGFDEKRNIRMFDVKRYGMLLRENWKVITFIDDEVHIFQELIYAYKNEKYIIIYEHSEMGKKLFTFHWHPPILLDEEKEVFKK